MTYRNTYRARSRKWFVANALIQNGMNKDIAYNILVDRVNRDKPFFYKDRDRDTWQPMDVARDRLKYEIAQVFRELMTQNPANSPEPEPVEPEPLHDPSDDEPDAMEPLVPMPEPTPETPAERFKRVIRKAREFVRNRDNFDWLDSMRIMVNGALALNQDIPVEFLISSMTAHWSQASRDQFETFCGEPGITRFDATAFAQDEREDGQHAAVPLVKRLLKTGSPLYLHGGAGTSKSTVARQCAEILGTTYRETTLAGATPSAIKGRDRLKEFVVSEFTQAYENGEIFCAEEMDSADPQVLLVINNALANGHFWNDAEGRAITRHPDFRFVATANTLGTGADAAYTGRERLDAATLDRVKMTRVHIELDTELEATVFDSIIAQKGE